MPMTSPPPFSLSPPTSSRWLLVVGGVFALSLGGVRPLWAAELATFTVASSVQAVLHRVDGTVEAVRDARVASQVPGRITEVLVKAGDRVQAGQVLIKIDPSAAAQQVAGGQAQLAQAQAMLTAAQADFERAKSLHAQAYVSRAALQHAEAQFKAAQAQARALMAQAAVASVQAGRHTIRAPFSGWVSHLPVSVGDMASPGLPLLAVYDPTALRAVASVAESVMPRLALQSAAQVQGAGVTVSGVRTTLLPSLDVSTHTATVRVDLPTQLPGWVPGQSVKLGLPLTDGGSLLAAMQVPTSAVVRRGEMAGVYVVDVGGRARLRQVRLGPVVGNMTAVLAGLRVGERLATDPVSAARGGAK